MKRVSRPKKNKIIGNTTIGICCVLLFFGLVSDLSIFHNCPSAKVLVYLDENFYRSLLTTIVSIQASIMCIGFSFIAIVSSFKTEVYLGINSFSYILHYRHGIFSFKNTLIVEFLLIVTSMVFTLLEYLNSVFACFISSIILLSYLFIDIINLLDSKKLHIFILEFLSLNICNENHNFLEQYVSWVISELQNNESANKENDYYADKLWSSCVSIHKSDNRADKENKKEAQIKKINDSFSSLVEEYLKIGHTTELNTRGIELCKSILTTYCNELDNKDIAEKNIYHSMKIWIPYLSSLYIYSDKQEEIEEIRKIIFCWENKKGSSVGISISRMLLNSVIKKAKDKPDDITSAILVYRAKRLIKVASSEKNNIREYDEAVNFILELARNGFIKVIDDVCFSMHFDDLKNSLPDLINTVVAYLFYIAFLEDEKIIQAHYNSLDPRNKSIWVLSNNFRQYSDGLKTIDFDYIKKLSEYLANYELSIPGTTKYELIDYRLPLSFVILIGIGSNPIPDLKKIIGNDPNSLFKFYSFFISDEKHTRDFFASVFNEFQFKSFFPHLEDLVYKNIRLSVLKALIETKTEKIRNTINLNELKLTVETELKEELIKLEINNNSFDSKDLDSETISVSEIIDTDSSYRYIINEFINKIGECVFNRIKRNESIKKLKVKDELSLAGFCKKTHDCDFILGGTIFFFGEDQKLYREVEELLMKHKYINTLLYYDERIDAFKDKIFIDFSEINVSISPLEAKETREQMQDIENRYLKNSPEEYSTIIKEDTIIDYINISMKRLELSCEITIGLDEKAGYYTIFQLP